MGMIFMFNVILFCLTNATQEINEVLQNNCVFHKVKNTNMTLFECKNVVFHFQEDKTVGVNNLNFDFSHGVVYNNIEKFGHDVVYNNIEKASTNSTWSLISYKDFLRVPFEIEFQNKL